MSDFLFHEILPVFDEHSKVLILGTFPSVKSREQGFFYGHPQNRFWRVTAALTGEALPQSIDEKRLLLLKNHIALWDVAASCSIVGSSDSSMKNVSPNDIGALLRKTETEKIFANGKTAEKLYNKLIYPEIKREITALPSTSPANASYDIEKLCREWSVILPYIK